MLKLRNMGIKILGQGCPKCKTLEKNVREAVADPGIDPVISKVDNIMDIIAYGSMSTPALVIDGKVVLKGFVPSISELKSLLNLKR